MSIEEIEAVDSIPEDERTEADKRLVRINEIRNRKYELARSHGFLDDDKLH